MATTKIWPVKGRLKDVTDYAANPQKTEWDDLRNSIEYAVNGEKTSPGPDEKAFLTSGIHCDAACAYEDMMAVKKAFGKTGGNVAYHAYQSFRPGEVTPEECHRIGLELAEKLWGDNYQVLVATHLDREHLHNHFVINSVSYVDGKKFNDNKAAYRLLRETSDEICSEHGLSVIEHPRGRTPRQIYLAEKNGEPTKYNLMRWAIDESVAMSTNQQMFEAVLKKKGYVIRMDPRRKYPVIRSIYGGRSVRLYHLGEEYEPQRIIARVSENDERVWEKYYGFMHDTGVIIRPGKIRIHAARPKHKITGIFALYIHYLYLLGYRLKRPNYQPLTPEMKSALRKCDEYSRHARLLAREHLHTESDVHCFIERTEDKIGSLCTQRQKIANKLRRCKDPVQIRQLKAQRTSLTCEITDLRQDRKTAGRILDRAETIRADIARETAALQQQKQRKKVLER